MNLDINTEDFARTICNNSQYLDDSTKSYVNNAGVKSVASNLNNITVVTGVDRNVVREIGNQLGLVDTPKETKNPANGDAFSIGGYIFIFESQFDSKKSENKYLLKHEAVHYIQSIAEGGTASFLTKYVNSVNSNQYYGSEYEKAAYSFGPKNEDAKSYYKDAVGSGNTHISVKPSFSKSLIAVLALVLAQPSKMKATKNKSNKQIDIRFSFIRGITSRPYFDTILFAHFMGCSLTSLISLNELM